MKTLTGLSSTPLQRLQVPIGNEVADCVLKYYPAIKSWYIDLTYNEIEIKNIRICHNLNILAQYSNILNFGIYVDVNGIVEPVLIDDFSTGRATLNILTDDEISLIEAGYSSIK